MNHRALNVIGSGIGLAVIVGALAYACTHTGGRTVARTPPTQAAVPPKPEAPTPTPTGVHPAPLELFASAQLGDWHAYRVVRGGSLAESRSTAMVWISAATAGSVTRAVRGRVDATGEERTGRSQEFPRAGLALEVLTGDGPAGWTLTEVAVSDDVRVVGGRSFRCKKVSYASADPLFPTKRTRTELWLSAEVPAGGLVAQREVQELDALRFEITQDLIGFGTAAGPTWGERPAGW